MASVPPWDAPRRSSRTAGADLGQPARRGPGGDPARHRGRGPRSRVHARAPRSCSNGRRPCGARSRRRAPAMWSSLAGKGHETTQTFADRVEACDDRELDLARAGGAGAGAGGAMPPLSVAEVVEATGGACCAAPPPPSSRSFSIDTRAPAPGWRVLRAAGDARDGHEFLQEAARAGAAAAVISISPRARCASAAGTGSGGRPRPALARCGSLARRKVPATVVALTGQHRKDHDQGADRRRALRRRCRVHRTHGQPEQPPGGAAHSAAPARKMRRSPVIEMGMSAPGEIARLAEHGGSRRRSRDERAPGALEFFRHARRHRGGEGRAVRRAAPRAPCGGEPGRSNVRVQAARHGGARVTFGQHPSADRGPGG